MSKRNKREFRKGRSGKSFALKTMMDEKEDVDTAEETDTADETETDDDHAQTFSFTNKDDDDDDENSEGKVIVLQARSKKKKRSPEPSPELREPTPPIFESFQAAPPKIKRRVTKSLKDVVKMINKDIEKEMEDQIKDNISIEDQEKEIQAKTVSVWRGVGGLSKSLSKASNIGQKMLPRVVFPAAPKLFRDGWVLAELLLTIVQFIYALIGTNYRVNRLYNGIYISLSVINLALALIDGFYYFYELGSCMILVRKCRKCFRKRKRMDYENLENGEESDEESDEEEEMESDSKSEGSFRCFKICRLSANKKEQLNMWFEVIRSVVSELLIYPLVVLDLFGVISDPQISDRLNFSFFVIGSFYLVLSVYISRVMTMLLTLLTLKGLLSASDSGKRNVTFIIRFLLHSIAQVVVHVSCVLAVAIKVKQENDHNNGRYHASPILWLVIIGGWVIPILGVITFFFINYFWAQQFSVGFFVELMALLQEGDVVESMMQGKEQTKTEANERSKQILEKMEYKKVKEEYKKIESTDQFSKISYPVKIPMYILLCMVYNITLGGFFACLLLTSKQGHIVVIPFNDFKGIALAVIAFVIALANIHLIIVSNLTIFVCLSVFFIVFFLPGCLAVPIFLLLMYLVRRTSKQT